MYFWIKFHPKANMKHADWCNLISLSIADSLSLPKDYNKKNDSKPEEEVTADTDEEEKQHLNGIFPIFYSFSVSVIMQNMLSLNTTIA